MHIASLINLACRNESWNLLKPTLIGTQVSRVYWLLRAAKNPWSAIFYYRQVLILYKYRVEVVARRNGKASGEVVV